MASSTVSTAGSSVWSPMDVLKRTCTKWINHHLELYFQQQESLPQPTPLNGGNLSHSPLPPRPLSQRSGSVISNLQVPGPAAPGSPSTTTTTVPAHPIPVVRSFGEDLKDGHILLLLLQYFSPGVQLNIPPESRQRIHHVLNVCQVLRILRDSWNLPLGLDQQQITPLMLSPTEILSGNEKVLLALVWKIMVHTMLPPTTTLSPTTTLPLNTSNSNVASPPQQRSFSENVVSVRFPVIKARLLQWLRNHVDPAIENFTTAWSNGLLFHRLLRSVLPADQLSDTEDELLADVKDPQQWPAICERAFDVARKHLQVPALLTGKDLSNPTLVDESSVVVYLHLLITAIRSRPIQLEASVAQVDALLGNYRATLESAAQKTEEWIVKLDLYGKARGGQGLSWTEVDESMLRESAAFLESMRNTFAIVRAPILNHLDIALAICRATPLRGAAYSHQVAIYEKLVKLHSAAANVSKRCDRTLETLEEKRKAVQSLHAVKAAYKTFLTRVDKFEETTGRLDFKNDDSLMFSECELELCILEDQLSRLPSPDAAFALECFLVEQNKEFAKRLDTIKKHLQERKRESIAKEGIAMVFEADVDSLVDWTTEKSKDLRTAILPADYVQTLANNPKTTILDECTSIVETSRKDIHGLALQVQRLREQCLRMLGGSNSKARDTGRRKTEEAAVSLKALDEAWSNLCKLLDTRSHAVEKARAIATFFQQCAALGEELTVLLEDIYLTPTDVSAEEESVVLRGLEDRIKQVEERVGTLMKEHIEMLATHSILDSRMSALSEQIKQAQDALDEKQCNMEEHRMMSSFYTFTETYIKDISRFLDHINKEPMPEESSIYHDRAALDTLQAACRKLGVEYEKIYNAAYEDFNARIRTLKDASYEDEISRESAQNFIQSKNKVDLLLRQLSTRMSQFTDTAEMYEQMYRIYQDGAKIRDVFAIIVLDLKGLPDEDIHARETLENLDRRYNSNAETWKLWTGEHSTLFGLKPPVGELAHVIELGAEKCVGAFAEKKRTIELYDLYQSKSEKILEIEPLAEPLLDKIDQVNLPSNIEKLEILRTQYDLTVHKIEELGNIVSHLTMEFATVTEDIDRVYQYRPGFRRRVSNFEKELQTIHDSLTAKRAHVNRENAFVEMRIQIDEISLHLGRFEKQFLALKIPSDEYELVTNRSSEPTKLAQRFVALEELKNKFEAAQIPLHQFSERLDKMCLERDGIVVRVSAIIVLNNLEQTDLHRRLNTAKDRVLKTEQTVAKMTAYFQRLETQQNFMFDSTTVVPLMEKEIAAFEPLTFPRDDGELVLKEFAAKVSRWETQVTTYESLMEEYKVLEKEPAQVRILVILKEKMDALSKLYRKAKELLSKNRYIMDMHIATIQLGRTASEMEADFEEAIRNLKALAIDGSESSMKMLELTRADITAVQTIVNGMPARFHIISKDDIANTMRPLSSRVDLMRQIFAFKENLVKYRQKLSATQMWLDDFTKRELRPIPREDEVCKQEDSQKMLEDFDQEYRGLLKQTKDFEQSTLQELISLYEAIGEADKSWDQEAANWVQLHHKARIEEFLKWKMTITVQVRALDLLLNLNPEFARGRVLEVQLLDKAASFSYDELILWNDDTSVEINDSYLRKYAEEVESALKLANDWIQSTHNLTLQSTSLGPIIASIGQAMEKLTNVLTTAKNVIRMQNDYQEILVQRNQLEGKLKATDIRMIVADYPETREIVRRMETWCTSLPTVPSSKAFEKGRDVYLQLLRPLRETLRIMDVLKASKELQNTWSSRLVDKDSIETLEPETFVEELQAYLVEIKDWLPEGKYHHGNTISIVNAIEPYAFSKLAESTEKELRSYIELIHATKDVYYLKHEEVLERILKHASSLETKLINATTVAEIETFVDAAEKKAIDLIAALSDWEALWLKPFQLANIEPFKLLVACKSSITKDLSSYQALAADGSRMKERYAAAQDLGNILTQACHIFEQTAFAETEKKAFDDRVAELRASVDEFEAKREQWSAENRNTSKLAHRSILIKKVDEKLFKSAKEKTNALLHLAVGAEKAYEEMVGYQKTLEIALDEFKGHFNVAHARRPLNSKIEDSVDVFSEKFKDFQGEVARWKAQLERGKSFKVLDVISEESKDLSKRAEILIAEAMRKVGYKHRMTQCEATIERLERDLEEVNVKFQEINPTVLVANSVMAMDIQGADGAFKSSMSLDEVSTEETVNLKSKLGGIKNNLETSESQLRELGVHIQHLEDALTGLKMFDSDVFQQEQVLVQRRDKIQGRCEEMRRIQGRKLMELHQQKDIQTLMGEVIEFRRKIQNMLQQCSSSDASTVSLSTSQSSNIISSGLVKRPTLIQGSDTNLNESFIRQQYNFENDLANITPMYEDLRARGQVLLRDTTDALNLGTSDLNNPNSTSAVAVNNRKNVLTFLDILQKSWQDAQRYHTRRIVKNFVAEATMIEAWMEERDRAINDLLNDFKNLERDKASESELLAINKTLKRLQADIGSNADVDQLMEHARMVSEKIAFNQKQCESIKGLDSLSSSRASLPGPEVNQVSSTKESVMGQWQHLKLKLVDATNTLAGAQELRVVEQRITALEETLATVTESVNKVKFLFSRPKKGAFSEKERLEAENWNLEQAKAYRTKFEETFTNFQTNFARVIHKDPINASKVETMKIKLEAFPAQFARKEEDKKQRLLCQALFAKLKAFEDELDRYAETRERTLPNPGTEGLETMEAARKQLAELLLAVQSRFETIVSLKQEGDVLCAYDLFFSNEIRMSRMDAEEKWRKLCTALKSDVLRLQDRLRYQKFQLSIPSITAALQSVNNAIADITNRGSFTVKEVVDEVHSVPKFLYDEFKYSNTWISEKYRKLAAELTALHRGLKSDVTVIVDRMYVEVDSPVEMIGSLHPGMKDIRLELWIKVNDIKKLIRDTETTLQRKEVLRQFATNIAYGVAWHEQSLKVLPGAATSTFSLTTSHVDLDRDLKEQEAIYVEHSYVIHFLNRSKAVYDKMAAQAAQDPIAKHFCDEFLRVQRMQAQLKEKLAESKRSSQTGIHILQFVELEVELEKLIARMQADLQLVYNGNDSRRDHLKKTSEEAYGKIRRIVGMNKDLSLNDFVLTHRKEKVEQAARRERTSGENDESLADQTDPAYIADIFLRRIVDMEGDLRDFDAKCEAENRLARRADSILVLNKVKDTANEELEAAGKSIVEEFLQAIDRVRVEIQNHLTELQRIRDGIPVDLLDKNADREDVLEYLDQIDYLAFREKHMQNMQVARQTKDLFKEKIQTMREQHQEIVVEYEDCQYVKKMSGVIFRALSAAQIACKQFQREVVEYRGAIISINSRHGSYLPNLRKRQQQLQPLQRRSRASSHAGRSSPKPTRRPMSASFSTNNASSGSTKKLSSARHSIELSFGSGKGSTTGLG